MQRLARQLSMAAAALAACVAASTASAQVTYATVDAPLTQAPGLTGFQTTGADMSGLSVMATFSGGLSQTLAWATTGASAGGVSGTGWSLSLSGDSFTAPWNFTFMDQGIRGPLTRLVLDGASGLTIFDRTFSGLDGTPGSAQGRDFSFASSTCGRCGATATYSGLTRIGGAAAVGDLWQTLTVDFTEGAGPGTNWAFLQDTDNDSRFVPGIPEPETYALMLAGLAALGAVARRKGKKQA